MPDVTIRYYTAADRPAVLRLLVAFQEHERAREPDYVPGEIMADDYLNALLWDCGFRGGETVGRVMVAEVEGVGVVAYVGFYLERVAYHRFDYQVVVNDLYVAADWRGRGIGRRFLDEADTHARRWDAARVLLTTLARNTEGRAMYAKCGFREIDVTLVRPVSPRPDTPERATNGHAPTDPRTEGPSCAPGPDDRAG